MQSTQALQVGNHNSECVSMSQALLPTPLLPRCCCCWDYIGIDECSRNHDNLAPSPVPLLALSLPVFLLPLSNLYCSYREHFTIKQVNLPPEKIPVYNNNTLIQKLCISPFSTSNRKDTASTRHGLKIYAHFHSNTNYLLKYIKSNCISKIFFHFYKYSIMPWQFVFHTLICYNFCHQ